MQYNPGNAIVREAARAATYEAVLDILGATGTIIPIGDPKHGLMSAATFKTVGAEQLVFTPNEPIADWDTKYGVKGIVPVIPFNGTDEEADNPDAPYWTRADAAFSVGAWVNMLDATQSCILSKTDATNDRREWSLSMLGGASDGKPALYIYDEDDAENDAVSVTATAALSENVWHFLVCTVNGGNDEAGMYYYLDGALDATAVQADTGDFGIMRDTLAPVQLGCRHSTPDWFFDGYMAGGPLGPFFTQIELSADAILRLYEIGRRALYL